MDITLAPETVQLIELAGNAIGIVLTLIVFAVGLGQIGASFIRTQIP